MESGGSGMVAGGWEVVVSGWEVAVGSAGRPPVVVVVGGVVVVVVARVVVVGWVVVVAAAVVGGVLVVCGVVVVVVVVVVVGDGEGPGWPVMTNRLRADPDGAVATSWCGPLSSDGTGIVTEKRPDPLVERRVGEPEPSH